MNRKLLNLSLGLMLSVPCVTALAQESIKKEHTISVSAGYGNMLRGANLLTKPTSEYKQSLRDGVSWNATYCFHPMKIWGVGILYSGYSSDGKHEEGADHIYTNYAAPQFFLYCVENKRVNAYFNMGVGYYAFRNKSEVFGKSRKVTSSGFGANLGFKAEYKFTRHWGIGVDCQFILSDLNEAKSRYHNETIHVDQSIYARNLALTGGISYHF